MIKEIQINLLNQNSFKLVRKIYNLVFFKDFMIMFKISTNIERAKL
jgi:hypothetical protein